MRLVVILSGAQRSRKIYLLRIWSFVHSGLFRISSFVLRISRRRRAIGVVWLCFLAAPAHQNLHKSLLLLALRSLGYLKIGFVFSNPTLSTLIVSSFGLGASDFPPKAGDWPVRLRSGHALFFQIAPRITRMNTDLRSDIRDTSH